MKPCRLFISQSALDQWTSEGRAVLKDNELLDQHTNTRYALCEGLRFVCEVSSTHDAHDLVGKVKDLDQLAALHAEHMADSVILGDNAYQVQLGFVCTPLMGAEVARPSDARDTLEALQKLILGRLP